MNDTTILEPFTDALIAEARPAAAAAKRRLVDVLEERVGAGPDAFTARLGATLHLPVLTMEDLRQAVPAFDLVSFNECAQRSCALLRGTHELWLATDDPFSGELQAWAEERVKAPFSWCLVHHGDLVAFLASHEETLRALDTVRSGDEVKGVDTEWVEDLSLKSISDEQSEVIRLVRSTLRDALMIGASDVHLEAVASGLVIKFRIDGILSLIKSIPDVQQ